MSHIEYLIQTLSCYSAHFVVEIDEKSSRNGRFQYNLMTIRDNGLLLWATLYGCQMSCILQVLPYFCPHFPPPRRKLPGRRNTGHLATIGAECRPPSRCSAVVSKVGRGGHSFVNNERGIFWTHHLFDYLLGVMKQNTAAFIIVLMMTYES